MTPNQIAAHTPGPYRHDGDQVFAADGYVIADTGGVHRHESHDADAKHWNYEDGSARDIGDEEEEANAALFAAAPDLLAACEAVEHAMRVDDSAFDGVALTLVFAAIAKACGVTP